MTRERMACTLRGIGEWRADLGRSGEDLSCQRPNWH